MKISILTPSYNQAKFIEKNIMSVLNQNWHDIEHVIIDGGSTDDTVKILKKYSHLNWISEPDKGQADALNKGLSLATGDIIGWINSDDYYQENIFGDVVRHFKDPEIKWIIGDVTYIYEGHNYYKTSNCKNFSYKNLLHCPDSLTQQGAFFKKSILNEIGGWNKEFHMVMDLDLWVRICIKYYPKIISINYAYFRWHSNQKSNYKNTFLQISEINRILIFNKVSHYKRYKIMIKKSYYYFKSFIKSILIDIGLIDKKFSTIPMSTFKLIK